jgi:hypothetical protein
MKLFTCALVIFLAVLHTPVYAQNAALPDPASRAAARKLLVAIDFRKLTQGSVAKLGAAIPAMLRETFKKVIDTDKKLSAAERKEAMLEFEKSIPKSVATINAVMNDPVLLDEVEEGLIPIWERAYTVSELEQLAAFYATPLGRKVLASVPQVMVESMRVSERIMGPKMEAAIDAAFDDEQ